MPVAITETPAAVLPLLPPRKRWTRCQVAAIESAGLLVNEYVELVGGELIDKLAKERLHSIVLSKMVRWFIEVFGWSFVQEEVPIDVAATDLSFNESEPDVVILKRDFEQLRTADPAPEDLHFVVEIADSSLSFDLKTKAALYARAAIPEY